MSTSSKPKGPAKPAAKGRSKPGTAAKGGRPVPPRPGARGGGPGGLRGSTLVIAGLAVAAVVALGIAVIVGGGGDDDGDSGTAASDAPNAVAGQFDVGDDPRIGEPFPELAGDSVTGEPMTIAPDGPTIVLFLAHWCPHCQAEVPVVQEWLDDGNLPDGVDVVAVATANDPRRPNYPAVDWLEREGFEPETLLDEDGADGEALDISSFPGWVFVDGEGNIAARTSGELTPDQITEAADALADM